MADYLQDTQVKDIEKETTPLVTECDNLKITDEKTYTFANDTLVWIKKTKKALEEKRKFFTAPLNTHIKEINFFFKKRSSPLDEAESILKSKIIQHNQELERERREKEEKLQKEALKNNTPAEVVPEQEKTFRGNYGATTTRKVWKYEVVHLGKVPRKLLVLNTAMINQEIRSGARKIPGLRIYQEDVLSVR